MAMAFNLLIAILLAVVAPAVHGVQHVVGSSNGWSQSADLATWASGETFTVGDTLLFTYSSMHSVDIVSKSDYGNCNSAKALQTFNNGQTTVALLKSGPMYFICPTFGHCSSGMKLAINVVAAATTPSGTPSTGTPPTTTPSGTPPITTPSGTPSTTTPGGDTAPSVLSPPTDSTPDSDGGSDTPTTASTTKSDNSGAEGHFGHFSRGMLGFSLVVVGLVALMG